MSPAAGEVPGESTSAASGATPAEVSVGSPRLRLVLLTILALILQLPAAVALSASAEVEPWGRAIRIGVAVASPLIFFLAHRWPGPRVAVLAGLTLLDVLVWAALSPVGRWHDFSRPSTIGSGPSADPGPGGPWWGPGGGGPWDWGGPESAPVHAAFLFALVTAILRGRWIWALASAGGLWLGALLLGPLLGIDWSVGRVASATIGLAVAAGLGALLRHRAESRRLDAERSQRRHAEAVQAERIRIARELHDVLGHSLSQINVQAGVGEHLLDRDPEQARRALAAIRELSSSGLDEVRAVLRTVRSAPLTPVRGLDDLPALIATMTGVPDIRLVDRRRDPGAAGSGGTRMAGTGASGESVAEVGTQPLSRAVDAAGYRIVQEALTNVIRHAEASTATVDVSVVAGCVQITVTDDGRGVDVRRSTERDGTGIPGMRERAELLGGSLSIASGPEGGTTVVARLPCTGPDAGRGETGDRGR